MQIYFALCYISYDFFYFWETATQVKETEKILLGTSDKPHGVIAFTGNSIPLPLITKSPELTLMFATDEFRTDTGFRLYFESGIVSVLKFCQG